MRNSAYTKPASLRKVAMLLACLTAVSFSASAMAQDSSIPYQMGGNTKTFGQARRQYAERGKLFRIEGHCRSACTMFLKLRNVCIDPNAELLFHAGEAGTNATQTMLNSYNARLRNFLLAHHYMDTPEFHKISGHDMIAKFGYRECPRE